MENNIPEQASVSKSKLDFYTRAKEQFLVVDGKHRDANILFYNEHLKQARLEDVKFLDNMIEQAELEIAEEIKNEKELSRNT